MFQLLRDITTMTREFFTPTKTFIVSMWHMPDEYLFALNVDSVEEVFKFIVDSYNDDKDEVFDWIIKHIDHDNKLSSTRFDELNYDQKVDAVRHAFKIVLDERLDNQGFLILSRTTLYS